MIKEIVRVSDDEGTGIKRRRRVVDDEEDDDEEDEDDNDNDGSDEDHTKKRRRTKTGKMQEVLPPEGVVVQYPSGQEIKKRM